MSEVGMIAAMILYPKKVLFTLVLSLCCLALSAQQLSMKGVIKDGDNGDFLEGVKVMLDSTSGAYTGEDGSFSFEVKPGSHRLDLFLTGYEKKTEFFDAVEGQNLNLEISLDYIQTELDIVVISGSQYEKKLSEETVSIDVIKPYLIENNNSIDLGGAMQKVPGVRVVDGQASIRGASGYAYSAGSRVQVLVDDMPLLASDLGDVRWEFVPIELAKQVEVIKGASSTLYGSSAVNGVINVRTGWAGEEPESKISLFQGFYANPKREELKWWDSNEQPFVTGAQFSHRRRIKDLDLVLGGNIYSTKHYRKSGDDKWGRFDFKTRYRPKNKKGITFGLNGNTMYQQLGRFFLWHNSSDSAYIAFKDDISREKYVFTTLDPHFTYVGDRGSRHTFRGRYYNVKKKLGSSERMNSSVYWMEYQYQKHFERNWVLTTGLVNSYSKSESNLFDKDSTGTYQSYFGAAYVQVEKKVGDKLSLIGGTRFELQTAPDTLWKSPLTFRTGFNYRAATATFLRGSFGQGYRVPSFVERFIDAEAIGVSFFPNQELAPEKAWSAELAVKQGVRIGEWQGYVDLALFWTEFQDMVEFTFTIKDGDFGFQAINVGRSRIAGMEFSAMGEGKIGPIPVRLFGGYTFNYPGDLEKDTLQRNVGTFMGNLFESVASVDSLQNSLLKYRSRDMGRLDIEADLKKFTLGFNLTFNGFMDQIDEVFEFIVDGVKDYRLENSSGQLVMNARLAYRPNLNTSITFLVKNMSNSEYMERPGLMGAPMNFTLQYKYEF